jgi:hypothetical protein
VVGNIRVDQAWGLFQISAAAHEVDASYNDLSAAVNGAAAPNNLSMISGHPDTKWGGSVMAALNIKNLPTGAGDDIKIDASYAVGDLKNIVGTAAASPSPAMFGGSGAGFASLGFGQVSDAVYLPAGLAPGSSGVAGPGIVGTGDLKLTRGWGVRGAFNHNWDPYWSSSLFGGIAAINYGGSSTDITTAKGQWCASYMVQNKLSAAATPLTANAAAGAGFSCNPNFIGSTLGVITRWTPVKNLTFSAEVGWFHLDQNMHGTPTLTAAPPMPVATYEYKNQDTEYLQVRVQRNF